jgi:hypothetical protein
MKTKLVLLLVAALVLGTAGTGLAARGKPSKPQKAAAKSHKPATKPAPKSFRGELRVLGIECPSTTVSIQGSFGGAGDGFMAVVVSKASGKAKSLAGKQVSVRLLKSTKVRRNGPTVVSKLKTGDRLNVVASMCSQGLVARTVTATGKKA